MASHMMDRVKRWQLGGGLTRDIVESRGMGGEGVEVESGGWGGVTGEKSTLV